MKSFLLVGALAASSFALPLHLQPISPLQKRADVPSDPDVLNFALNLEYLEAEFYSRAAFGHGLDPNMTTGKGTQGSVKGGYQVDFKSDVLRQYANEIAMDEIAHVKLLRTSLGDAAIAEPDIDIDQSFTAAARAAGIIGENDAFDAYSSETNFLLAAFLFEDVGVTAYKGAAPLIQDKETLAAAAGLLAVEAYHASELRTTLYSLGQKTSALIQNANKISDARAALSGGSDQGIQVDGKANIVPADENGLAFDRTPGGVLDIVYLSGDSGVTSGGFFPKGVNGALNSTDGASMMSQ